MEKIKTCYIATRCNNNCNNSKSYFRFELKEALELQDNTVCYIGDIPIPHSWFLLRL